LEVDEIKTIPHVPVSHPFVERLIGTIRREFLDHVVFWNSLDLRRKLDSFRDYYNADRVHSSLGGETPVEVGGCFERRRADMANYTWERHCHGLVDLPVAA